MRRLHQKNKNATTQKNFSFNSGNNLGYLLKKKFTSKIFVKIALTRLLKKCR